MADLIARSPFAGHLPIAHGTVAVDEIDPVSIVSVAPFRGREATVSEALEAKCGLPLTEPGRFASRGGARVAWSGLDQWFVFGVPDLDALTGAAVTDQSDAWAACAVTGPDAADVLARLVPIDLRSGVFAEGGVARTMLGHMACMLLRTGPERFEVLVFRSMAGSAAHDLDRAARGVAARGTL